MKFCAIKSTAGAINTALFKVGSFKFRLSAEFYNGFYDSNFCLKYNLLIYPISYNKNYPHPYSNGSIKRKKYMKMFPFCLRNP